MLQVGGAEDGGDPFLAILRQPVETRATEFKESQPFESLKWKILRACMAMANLREGGRIIIGVSERNGAPDLCGILPEHAVGYTQDTLIALVNRHARPAVFLTLRFVEFGERRFVGIEVQPFDRVPIICGVVTPDEAGRDGLRVGDILARTRDRVSTSRVGDANLIAEIIEVAAEKRAQEIIATAQRIGLRMPDSDRALFESERRAFGDFG
ncbi:MAG: ATP-binding protein [Acidiferrobacteraceae bacterium]